MKLPHCLVGCALLACAGVVQAAVIPVVNGSFENGLTQGVIWYQLPVETNGWVAGAYTSYMVYDIGNTSDQHFTVAPDGVFVLNTDSAATTGGITETLNYTVNPGDVFILDFYVGRSLKGQGAGTLTASILVGTSTIGTNAMIATTAAQGAWDHKTVTGTATTGGPLSISFAKNSDAPWLDKVTMTVVPEPASLGLLSLAGLALMRRRK